MTGCVLYGQDKCPQYGKVVEDELVECGTCECRVEKEGEKDGK